MGPLYPVILNRYKIGLDHIPPSLSFLSYFCVEEKNLKESRFQADLIKRLKSEFPGCLVLKNDANYIQGIPDLSIFYKNRWAMLECKKSAKEAHQPNQDYYVGLADEMSFARFVSPENVEEVINELQQSLQPKRSTRISKRK